jgi:hypothetical protein
VLAVFASASAACGGDGDDAPDTESSATRSATRTSSTERPSAGPSVQRGSPNAAVSPATTPNAASGGPTPAASADSTPSSADATLIAGAGGDIAGGDPSAPRENVSDAPTPPPGATIDPTVIAPPDPAVAGLQVLVDADATSPGIQATRTVAVGDVFRVAVVAANAADIAAYNFFLDYDRGLAIAPSYTGGSTTDRNPDLDEGTMGAGWSCLPAPEGDIDDPGGIDGDGNPATGRALLSCFNTTASASGSVVLAVIELRAVSAGSLSLALNEVALGNSVGAPLGQCNGGVLGDPDIPCTGATVTIQ